MKEEIIWELRTEEVKNALREGKRLDGRKFDEHRKIVVEKGVYKNADGSARVKIGETEVVCGVKMVPGEPYPDVPDSGTIVVGMELLALVLFVFEPGPPREDAIELARIVDRSIREAQTLDFKELCITPGEKVWIVFIDIYAMDYSGNLFDTSALAALAALLDTKIPKLEGDEIVKGEHTGSLNIKRKPMLLTFAKIDSAILADPILAEEKASDARFSVASTEDGFLTAFQKGGRGSFSLQEIDKMIDLAFAKGKEMRKKAE